MKTNFKTRLLINGGIIVVSIVFGVVAFVYLSRDLHSAADKFVSGRATTQANTAALGRLAELEHDAPAAAVYETAINTLLPTQSSLINTPPEVTALATADGVTANFSFQGNPSTPAEGSFGIVPFSLDVEGPMEQVTTFLSDFETKANGYLLNITSLSVLNSDSGAHLSAQGNLFFQ